MSNGHHWSKFWWKDWQAEPCLRRCSIAARGLWMELLCIAHDGEPYGHLRENGRDLTPKDLTAMIANITLKEVTKLLGELEAQGVFSRTESGTIYNRRMQKDSAQSDVGREYVARRWGSNGAHPPNRGAIRSPTTKPNTGASRRPTSTPNHPEARSTDAIEAKKEREVYINTTLSSEIPGACARKDAPISQPQPPSEPMAHPLAVANVVAKVVNARRHVEYGSAWQPIAEETYREAAQTYLRPRPGALPLVGEALKAFRRSAGMIH